MEHSGSADLRLLLASRIPVHARAGEFLVAVVAQIGRSGGIADRSRLLERADDALRLLGWCRTGESERAGTELAADPPLLAAFFQNIDLLYDQGFEAADAVSASIMQAVHHLQD